MLIRMFRGRQSSFGAGRIGVEELYRGRPYFRSPGAGGESNGRISVSTFAQCVLVSFNLKSVAVSSDEPATVNGETERAWIERHRRRLEEERQKFTEAAVRLGKERAEMEVRLHEYVTDVPLLSNLLCLYFPHRLRDWRSSKRNVLSKSNSC